MESVADPRLLIPARTKSSRRMQALIEQMIKAFFGGNALVAVVVLALITIFLFREGSGFFGQNLANLRLYRQAGLEYVDIIRDVSAQQEALSRSLSDIRLREVRTMEKRNVPLEEINSALAPFDQFATAFSDSAENIRGLLSDLTDQASALKEQLFGQAELAAQRKNLRRSGNQLAAEKIVVAEVDRLGALARLRQGSSAFDVASAEMSARLLQLLGETPALPDPAGENAFEQWKTKTRGFVAALPAVSQTLRAWSPDEFVPWYRSISSFLFGKEWVTASFWQDWYGIIPLLVGSGLVSIVALVIAVPLGVASAIYVSEIASPHEKRLIKPYIEFISAIPSVNVSTFLLPDACSRSWPCRRSSLYPKTRFAMCRAGSRRPPTRSARTGSRPSGASSFRRHFQESSRPFFWDSGASSAKRWSSCFARETGSRFPISPRDSGRCFSRSTP